MSLTSCYFHLILLHLIFMLYLTSFYLLSLFYPALGNFRKYILCLYIRVSLLCWDAEFLEVYSLWWVYWSPIFFQYVDWIEIILFEGSSVLTSMREDCTRWLLLFIVGYYANVTWELLLLLRSSIYPIENMNIFLDILSKQREPYKCAALSQSPADLLDWIFQIF